MLFWEWLGFRCLMDQNVLLWVILLKAMKASLVITPSPVGSHFFITSKISSSVMSSFSSSASSFRSSTEM